MKKTTLTILGVYRALKMIYNSFVKPKKESVRKNETGNSDIYNSASPGSRCLVFKRRTKQDFRRIVIITVMQLKCWFCKAGWRTKAGLWEHMSSRHETDLKKAIMARKLPVNWVTWLSRRRVKSIMSVSET